MRFLKIRGVKSQPVGFGSRWREEVPSMSLRERKIESARGYDEVEFQQEFWARTGDESRISPPPGTRCRAPFAPHPIKGGTDAYDCGPHPNGFYVYVCPAHFNQIPTLESLEKQFIVPQVLECEARDLRTQEVVFDKQREAAE